MVPNDKLTGRAVRIGIHFFCSGWDNGFVYYGVCVHHMFYVGNRPYVLVAFRHAFLQKINSIERHSLITTAMMAVFYYYKRNIYMLETILSKLGLPFLISAVSRALGGIDNPIAITASESLSKVEQAIANGTITIEQTKEANRHIEQLAQIDGEALKAINESLRAEIASSDAYVRRMRPTFGYLMAFTWTLQMSAIAYIMVFETAQASVVVRAVESLSSIWAVALSVLGIYVYKRSEDKKLN